MSYLLDSNACIALINDRSLAARERFEAERHARRIIMVSSVVVFELGYGVAKSAHRQRNAAVLDAFLSNYVTIAPFDDHDAHAAARVRAALEAAGAPIGPYDMLIAGQALRHGATLVTSNTREFARVKGLRWEDWARTR